MDFYQLTFLTLIIINLALAIVSNDWRLRRCGVTFLAVWLISFFPYAEPISSLFIIVYFSRLQVRLPNEEKLSWWLVPVIVSEFGILSSHIIYFSGNYLVYWFVVNSLFLIQLLIVITTGLRRIKHNIGRKAAGRMSEASAPDFSYHF